MLNCKIVHLKRMQHFNFYQNMQLVAHAKPEQRSRMNNQCKKVSQNFKNVFCSFFYSILKYL